jgi:hypothetical protein
MKPCQRFKESIMQHFDENLDTVGRKELEHHLKVCTSCNRYMNQIRLLRSHLRELTPIEASENFHILLRERIRRDLARSGRRHVKPLFTRRLIPAFGLTVVLVTVGIWFLDQRSIPIGTPGTSDSLSEYQPDSSLRSRFDGQIQYVIDDYPNPISVSRQDDARVPKLATEDSVLLKENRERYRSRMTPVSF